MDIINRTIKFLLPIVDFSVAAGFRVVDCFVFVTIPIQIHNFRASITTVEHCVP